MFLLLVLAVGAAAAGPLSAEDPSAATGQDAYRYLVEYAGHGLHRSGTPGGDAVTAWAAQKLEGFGIATHTEEFRFARFVPRAASIRVEPETADEFSPVVHPWYYSGTTGPEGVRAELVALGAGTRADYDNADVAGKIVLLEVPLAINASAVGLEGAVERAHERGAALVVAAIQAVGNEIHAENADARLGMGHMPVLIVGKRDGAQLAQRSGQIAHAVLDGVIEEGVAANVVGVIPGSGQDIVVVGTPLHGWFTTASERGGGVGTFLTLARLYGERVYIQQPEVTIMFLGLAGHEVGYLGLDEWIQAHPELLGRITAYVHLGASVASHGAKEVGDEVVYTGVADDNRFVILSENPIIEALAAKAFAANPAGPMTFWAGRVLNPGEQQLAYAAGIPIFSMSGAHLWFHTPADLPYTTNARLLHPIVGAYRSVIDGLLEVDGDAVRQANAPAKQLGGS